MVATATAAAWVIWAAWADIDSLKFEEPKIRTRREEIPAAFLFNHSVTEHAETILQLTQPVNWRIIELP